MSPLDLVRLALARLRSSRLRAALTMLGVIIGVGSVVALVAVGQGATSGITNQLESLGTNLLTINPGGSTSFGTRGAAGSATTLTVDDAAAVGGISGVAEVAPELSTQKLVVAGTENTTTSIVGTTPSYLTVHNDTIWQGSFLTAPSNDHRMRVAVLGATTATDLGLDSSAVGTDITIGGIPFQVIGILQSKGGTGPLNQDDMILVPLDTVRADFVGGQSVRSIGVSVATAEQMPLVEAEITTLLKSRHGLGAADAADFSVFDQAQLLTTVNSITGLLTVLLAGIASISLIVGGIGIMNIMLVSVRERTREIGIRKAIGAKSRDILFQFLIEALVLSVLGGLIGILLGLIATAVIGAIAGWGFAFSPVTLVVALLFSLAVGVIFGVWPARQAARLDPIAALRYE